MWQAVLASTTSLPLATVALTVCMRRESTSTLMCAFIPERHWMASLVVRGCALALLTILRSCCLLAFVVERGAAMSVAVHHGAHLEQQPIAL